MKNKLSCKEDIIQTEKQLIIISEMYYEACDRFIQSYENSISRIFLLELARHVIRLAEVLTDLKDKQEELNRIVRNNLLCDIKI